MKKLIKIVLLASMLFVASAEAVCYNNTRAIPPGSMPLFYNQQLGMYCTEPGGNGVPYSGMPGVVQVNGRQEPCTWVKAGLDAVAGGFIGSGIAYGAKTDRTGGALAGALVGGYRCVSEIVSHGEQRQAEVATQGVPAGGAVTVHRPATCRDNRTGELVPLSYCGH